MKTKLSTYESSQWEGNKLKTFSPWEWSLMQTMDFGWLSWTNAGSSTVRDALLWGGKPIMAEAGYMWAAGEHEQSPYYPLSFAVNLRLLQKYIVLKKEINKTIHMLSLSSIHSANILWVPTRTTRWLSLSIYYGTILLTRSLQTSTTQSNRHCSRASQQRPVISDKMYTIILLYLP